MSADNSEGLGFRQHSTRGVNIVHSHTVHEQRMVTSLNTLQVSFVVSGAHVVLL